MHADYYPPVEGQPCRHCGAPCPTLVDGLCTVGLAQARAAALVEANRAHRQRAERWTREERGKDKERTPEPVSGGLWD